MGLNHKPVYVCVTCACVDIWVRCTTAWWGSVSNICVYTQLNHVLIAVSWRLCAPRECSCSCLYAPSAPQTQTLGSGHEAAASSWRHETEAQERTQISKTRSSILTRFYLNRYPTYFWVYCQFNTFVSTLAKVTFQHDISIFWSEFCVRWIVPYVLHRSLLSAMMHESRGASLTSDS